MLYWWLQQWTPEPGATGTGDSRVFLTARIAFAALTSFIAALALGPLAIRWLKRQGIGERIDSASGRLNELHAAKRDTPTMGGVFIVTAIVLSSLLWADLTNSLVLCGLILGTALMLWGGVDDWVKLRTRTRGLTARQKLAGQIVMGVAAAIALRSLSPLLPTPLAGAIVSPFSDHALALGPLFVAWAAFVMVGSSNGVNLTDGLDGLAAGCLVFSGAALSALAYAAGNRVMSDYLHVPHVIGAGELAVMTSALVGACLGFLWFNGHPAQVFMGDAGSLPLGALLGYVALAIKQELLLALIGGVFVIETLSVILQIGIYRVTGRRILACSPLHHHFQFRGIPESRIVLRFWIVAALLAIAGLATLRLR
jgi:phospho-N-acetylmuramoyl-pentapeptide-transferase